MNTTLKVKAIILLSVLTLSSQSLADGYDQRQYKQSKRAYVRADIGASFLEFGSLSRRDYASRLKPSVVYAAGAGYEINNRIKADFTVSHRAKYRYDGVKATQSIRSTAFMLNGYYNVVEAAFSPYLMAGLGIAFNKAGNYADRSDGTAFQEKTTSAFAWQAGAGLIYKFNNYIHTDLAYRYVSSNVAKTSNIVSGPAYLRKDSMPIEARMKSHECTIGLIYKF